MKHNGKRLSRLELPQVTLCAVSSVNLKATVAALKKCLFEANFSSALLFTDAEISDLPEEIRLVKIPKLNSSREYSEFILLRLCDFISSEYCLVVQWDGHIIDATKWCPDFFNFDYIGASWPQFSDGFDVGNGGFSLRSRRMMELCRHNDFQICHPEDIAIGRANRTWLEANNVRFAPRAVADRFSTERSGDLANSFGYHGVWLMPQVLGIEEFWSLYSDLDERGTIRHDFAGIVRQAWKGPGGWRRAFRLALDQTRLKA